MDRRFQYYVPFTNHTQYRARKHNNTLQKYVRIVSCPDRLKSGEKRSGVGCARICGMYDYETTSAHALRDIKARAYYTRIYVQCSKQAKTPASSCLSSRANISAYFVGEASITTARDAGCKAMLARTVARFWKTSHHSAIYSFSRHLRVRISASIHASTT